MNAANLLALGAPFRDAHRVLVVPPHAHLERLESALEQPRCERIGSLAPEHHLLSHFFDEWRGSAHHATENVVMTVQILRGGVDDDIRAVLDRSQVDRTGERRINDERDPFLARDVTDRPEVEHATSWICRHLDEYRSRLFSQ